MILPEVEVLGLQAPISFGQNGRLRRPVDFQLRSGEVLETHTIDVGGVVR